MEIRSITDVAGDLIKAIDENCEEVQDDIRKDDTEIIIKQRFIADELEELREWVKTGTLEIRDTKEVKELR